MAELIVELKQHTEMLHFQNEKSVDLRMTELKPKLDWFVWEFLSEKERSEWLAPNRRWARKDDKGHVSLAYKVRMSKRNEKELNIQQKEMRRLRRQEGRPDRYEYDYSSYIFFQADQNEHRVLRYPSLELSFFSFYPAVLKTIQDRLGDFFYLHNFGYRQRKGFGSFTVERIQSTGTRKSNQFPRPESINERLLPTMPQLLAIIDFRNDCSFVKGKDSMIAVLYQSMKSGINFRGYVRSFLTNYLAKYSIEKQIIKKYLISKGEELKRTYRGPNPSSSQDSDIAKVRRTARVVLGMGYLSLFQRNRGKPIEVKHEYKDSANKVIARYPSPILFKVVDNRLLIFGSLHAQSLYLDGSSHSFTAAVTGGVVSETIPVLSSNEFDLRKFVEAWVRQLEHHKRRADRLPQEYVNVLNKIVRTRVIRQEADQ